MDSQEHVKKEVYAFWNSSPCGTYVIKEKVGTKEYFEKIEEYRYSRPPYAYDFLPVMAEFNNHRNEMVLEVGCGIGTDLIQFARGGAIVSGIDLTDSGIKIAKARFKLFGLAGNLQVGDAENLPFGDKTFDYVYSFGVLHHTPNTQKTIDEIYRVLRPGGRTTVMLYHKNSLEYMMLIVRKMIHPERWKWSTLKAVSYETEMNRNRGGPTNPLTKVYTKSEVRKMFCKFEHIDVYIRYLQVPIISRFLPKILSEPLSRVIGWNIIIKARRAK